MRVMAQLAMVMNLDKCIGCHTCSVTCKQAWTNRSGAEYVWFNNVETRPGQGYPRTYEDQDRWAGGWVRDKRGRLRLRAGGRLQEAAPRSSPTRRCRSIDDYYEPWTYDYENLTTAPLGEHMPVAPPRSLISGKPMKVSWSANWDDDLGGSPGDPARRPDPGEGQRAGQAGTRADVHVLPAADLRALPEPVVRRVVPVGGDVQARRGRHRAGRPGPVPWLADVRVRLPVQEGVLQPQTGKAEKCTFCYPRIEVGLPTVCAETCVGRLRYIGLVLYDVDRVLAAASVGERHRPVRGAAADPARPDRPGGDRRRARPRASPTSGSRPRSRSPVYALINTYRVALPLHPEYRTMPMVWYIPPLSPVVDAISRDGHDGEDLGNLFGALEALRIPIEYLAGLFTAGDTGTVEAVLRRLAAMRSYMRDINLGRETQPHIPASVGMTEEQMYEMYRLLAIAKYEERYVIPTAYAAEGHRLEETVTECALSIRRRTGDV